MTPHWRTTHTTWFRSLAPSIVLSLCTLAATGTLADFQAGVAAHNRQDYATALREFSSAAGQGDAAAQYNLGLMYAQGQGVAQNKKQAAAWYRKAAAQGHAAAQYNLGLMYNNGEGVAPDKQQAETW